VGKEGADVGRPFYGSDVPNLGLMCRTDIVVCGVRAREVE